MHVNLDFHFGDLLDNEPFQLPFNAAMKLDFQGSGGASDGRIVLVLVRELDERPGFILRVSSLDFDRVASIRPITDAYSPPSSIPIFLAMRNLLL